MHMSSLLAAYVLIRKWMTYWSRGARISAQIEACVEGGLSVCVRDLGAGRIAWAWVGAEDRVTGDG